MVKSLLVESDLLIYRLDKWPQFCGCVRGRHGRDLYHRLGVVGARSGFIGSLIRGPKCLLVPFSLV